MKLSPICLLFCLLASAIGTAAGPGEKRSTQLILFHAGSLVVPFDKIIEGFKKVNPGIEVLREVAGSRECARKISELHKPCDVFASSDYLQIDMLLVPEFADWSLKFATNEMTIVYGPKSRRSKALSQKNWLEVLQDPEIAFGRADPDADPCGYRTILTLKLAELYYRRPGLTDSLLQKKYQYIRPKEVDLLALLETGEVDFIFLYRSVAEQHGLPFLTLPDEINLKRAELENYYRQVSVELNAGSPCQKITQRGGSMVYGVTIPKNAPNPEAATKFIHYLLNEEQGLAILRQMGQPTVVPSECERFEKLPHDLQKYARPVR
jgi:molybdate/tungstate transport system substrate-binding protein